jgi:UDP-N-acetylmuramate dehydrogenase
MRTVERKGDRLVAAAGAGLGALAVRAAEEELGGLEFARGIPGSLGGAIYMNAGAYGSSIGDILCRSRAMDRNTGEIFTLTDHGFDYRKSIYMKHPEWICLGAELALVPRKRQEIETTMAELARKRRDSQPLEYPSAGSYFKRPEGHFAGKLIEDAGLKGTRVGGAEVSEKHAGFLLNRGEATAKDILDLEALVCQRVRELFGVILIPEVQKIETE